MKRRRYPTIRQVAKVDPVLADKMREIRRLKAEPLERLKRAAIAYGKAAARCEVHFGSFFRPEAVDLLATAAGFYRFQEVLKSQRRKR